MDQERGYVIRCHNLFNGTTIFKGCKEAVYKNKDVMRMEDTYTLTGAKKAMANYKRMSPDDDYQCSLERLEECYIRFDRPERGKYSKLIEMIDAAAKRCDELVKGNDFHNIDKMRINEIKRILYLCKEEFLKKRRKKG